MPAHTPGPVLADKLTPPTESRLNRWQMTLLPVQMLPQPPSRRARPMTVVRRVFLYLYALAVEQEQPTGSGTSCGHPRSGGR